MENLLRELSTESKLKEIKGTIWIQGKLYEGRDIVAAILEHGVSFDCTSQGLVIGSKLIPRSRESLPEISSSQSRDHNCPFLDEIGTIKESLTLIRQTLTNQSPYRVEHEFNPDHYTPHPLDSALPDDFLDQPIEAIRKKMAEGFSAPLKVSPQSISSEPTNMPISGKRRCKECNAIVAGALIFCPRCGCKVRK